MTRPFVSVLLALFVGPLAGQGPAAGLRALPSPRSVTHHVANRDSIPHTQWEKGMLIGAAIGATVSVLGWLMVRGDCGCVHPLIGIAEFTALTAVIGALIGSGSRRR